ncbi:cytochrome P450 [Lojkania enalia]|uniref:Cytochrome P450 n=1 Tax=Lojkania enalia TaxID=147567 RepID=A0A9P4KIY3_9PLEO|nr:cytochrome P450 [Didymosphaeria enalia]
MTGLMELVLKISALSTFLIFLFALLKSLYNLLLHPLRSFPGPISARATALTYHYASVKGNLHLWLQSLHERYGPVVRFAPNELSFITPSVWRDAYGYRATAFTKDKIFYGPDLFGDPPGILRADNTSHTRQRKLVAPAFGDRALKQQAPITKAYVTLLVQQLREAIMMDKKGKVDIRDWYNFTTFDIMGDMTFGEPLNLLSSSQYTPWVRSIFDNAKLTHLNSVIRAWPFLHWFMRAMIPQSIKEKRETVLRYSVERVERRLATRTDRPDIWTHVLRHSEDEENKDKGLAQTEMWANATFFMIAGTETTATVLTGLTFYLLKNPDKLGRLQSEIRGAFEASEDMTLEKLVPLAYLNACIEEGLRLYPPVCLGLPRTVPKGGAMIEGLWVPGGVNVQVAQYAAYHSSTNFKNPKEFVPERWLPEGQAEYGQDHKDILNPFSYGPRNCLGKNLAYHEMRLILAMVLWHFDMVELCPESEQWLNQKVYVLWDKGPLMVKLKFIRD